MTADRSTGAARRHRLAPGPAPSGGAGTPDARGPLRYLWWLVRSQIGRALTGAMWGSLWMIGLTLPPYVVARGIDDGLSAQGIGPLLGWSAALLGAGALNAFLAIMRHRTMTFVRLDATVRTVGALVRHTVALGAGFAHRSSTGELVTVTGSDVARVSQTLTLTGPGVGAVVAYALVTVLLLSISAQLAAVVLIGVPVLALCVGPLLGRLQHVESAYRSQQGALTARAVDMVAGFRMLAGVGGAALVSRRYRQESQRLRQEGFRVAAVTSWVQALGAGLPALFLAVVTWLSARMAASGEISVGEMVAVYGYVAVLVVPVGFLIEGADDLGRGLVAARRVIGVLRAEPEGERPGTEAPEGPAELRDPDSGVTVAPGRFLGLCAHRPGDGAAVLERLGRYGRTGATWGSRPLADVPLAEVRARILVADHDAYLFAGTLGEAVTPGDGPVHAERARRALRVAAAEDVLASLPDGLDSPVDAGARDLSGGQRQRLRLARALLADPEVLLLCEPVSALDAPTEALVAEGLRADRAGRTTVVASTSPLVLERADRVACLRNGRVVAEGTHAELLRGSADYRALVLRDTTALPSDEAGEEPTGAST